MSFVIEDIREQLLVACKGRERLLGATQRRKNLNAWVVNWENGTLSPTTIKDRGQALSGDASAVQKEFVAGVLEYMSVLEKVRASQWNEKRPIEPPPGFPYHGPLFHPPAHFDLWLRGEPLDTWPDVSRLQPILVLHPVFFPQLHLNRCPVSGCTGRVKRRRPTIIHTLYGLTGNVKTIGEQYLCSEHKGFSVTTPEFWMGCSQREIGNFPCFFREGGMTRELFEFIAKYRSKGTPQDLLDYLTRMHFQAALRAQESFPNLYQQEHTRSSLSGDTAPFSWLDASSVKVPSIDLIRAAYSIFDDEQRLPEGVDRGKSWYSHNFALQVRLHIISGLLRGIESGLPPLACTSPIRTRWPSISASTPDPTSPTSSQAPKPFKTTIILKLSCLGSTRCMLREKWSVESLSPVLRERGR